MLMQMQATGTIGIKLMASPKLAAAPIPILQAAIGTHCRCRLGREKAAQRKYR